MNIALFGGSFDPPHLGHLVIAQKVIDQHLADELWYLPVKNHEFGKQMSDGSQRLALLQHHLRAHSALYQSTIKINTYQLDQPTPTATHQVLQAFTQLYPDTIFSFVIGSDNVAHFDQWIEWEFLLAQFQFYVYPRQGYPVTQLYPGMTLIKDVEPMPDSSTAIRQRLQSGNSISDLVVPAVDAYIREHHLYVT